jgi:protein involved in polysaccharide export with SLBB domain
MNRDANNNISDDKRDRVENGTRSNTMRTTAKFRNEITHNVTEVNWDYAVVQRLNPDDLSIRLLSFNVAKAVIEKDPENNLLLEPGDVITIFSKADLAAPLEKQTKFVRLEGELRSGVYRVEPGETLRHLVARAGGLTPKAYLYGAEFTRESVREEQQKGLDEMVQSLEKEILENPTSGADIAAERQLVDKLRELKPTGRIVLEVKPDSAGVESLPDIPLEDGDRLVVPYRSSTVAVLGAVYNKSSFIYHQNSTLGKYLRSAGGPTRGADNGRVFVIRANGSVVSKQSVSHLWSGSFEAMRLLPGDAIVVPEKMNRGAGLKAFRDWSQILSSLAFAGAALHSL